MRYRCILHKVEYDDANPPVEPMRCPACANETIELLTTQYRKLSDDHDILIRAVTIKMESITRIPVD